VPVLLGWISVQLVKTKFWSGEQSRFRAVWFSLLTLFFGLNLLAAVWQVVTSFSLGLHFLGEPFLSPGKTGVAWQPIGDYRFALLRGYGLMQHPNALGFVGVLGFWFALNFLKNSKWRTVLLVCGLCLGILSFSRIAWVALSGLGLLWIIKSRYWSPNNKLSDLIKIVVDVLKNYWWLGLGVASLFLYIFLSRFAYEHGTDRVRLGEYIHFGQTYGDLDWWQKLFGIGLGQYPYYLRLFNPQLFWWEWQPIHNLWLSLFVELGVVGFVLLILTLVYFFSRLVGFRPIFDKN
jgi:hypothetical protein